MTASHLTANVERFSACAEVYDKFRPSPPPVLIDVLTQYAQIERPRLVVDLGSGTGLSTRFWQDRAERVIGIEPNDDMRAQAVKQTNAPNVRYLRAFSHDTGLPDACADIVTCAQSLHWMEPEPTFKEIARILRAGGVFAAYDCDWPQTMNREAEEAFDQFMIQAHHLGDEHHLYDGVKKWKKDGHVERMEKSGCFSYVREIVLHHAEQGDAERLVGIALSQSEISTLLRNGFTEDEIGVNELRENAKRAMGDRMWMWYFGYRVRMGIK